MTAAVFDYNAIGPLVRNRWVPVTNDSPSPSAAPQLCNHRNHFCPGPCPGACMQRHDTGTICEDFV